ncbi:MAG: 3-dehydroquinate synthase [Anaerolineaceae bacterium]|nr:3-dehydroquinate synthase [Anaerolineaceae bacterium]
MARIPVKGPGGGYDIVIEPGLLQDGERLAGKFGLARRVAVGTTDTIAGMHGHVLARRLPDAVLVTMPDGEKHKSLATVSQLYSDFVAAGLDRQGTVLALGGGVACDTFGFAATTYLRGVRLVMAPTSLLAMVDASVGGKTGVDIAEGKNLVGTFARPAAVLIDSEVLETLPEGEWRNGMAEVLKHGLLADAELLDPALHSRNNALALVARAVQVKVDLVQRDPFEQNVRAWLNLGHTFAHAIELVSDFHWSHGEAVGVGLVAAARLSHAIGLCSLALADQVEACVAGAGLPVRLGGMDAEAICAAMATDKKRRAGRVRFVLLRAIHDVTLVDDVPMAAVVEVLNGMQGIPLREGRPC